MDYNKLTKAEIIKATEEKDAELERLKNEKIHNEEEFSDMERLKKENALFLKGTREKDASIAKLQEQINATAEQQAKVFQKVENEANQKIATISQQNVNIAKEYEFAKNGMANFVETIDDIMEYHETAHKAIKNLVKRLKSVYTEEE